MTWQLHCTNAAQPEQWVSPECEVGFVTSFGKSLGTTYLTERVLMEPVTTIVTAMISWILVHMAKGFFQPALVTF